LLFKNKQSALYAALAFSLSLIPIFLSHWGKMHGPMGFFFLLSLFFALKFEKTKQKKHFYWCVAGASGAIAAHYLGMVAAIFPLLVFLFNRRQFNLKIVARGIGLYFLIIAVSYLPNYHGVWLMIKSQIWDFQAQTGFTGMYPGLGLWEKFYFVFRDSFLVEPIFILALAIFGIMGFNKLRKSRPYQYILLGLLFNYLIMITIVAWPGMSRWLLIFISLAVILSAGWLMDFLIEKNLNKYLLFFIALILLVPNILITVRWLNIFHANTRFEAVIWMEKNVKPDEFVYNFDSWLDAPLSYQAAAWNEQNNLGRADSKKLDFIVSHPAEYQNKGINLLYDYNNFRYQTLGLPATKYVYFYRWGSQSGGSSFNVGESMGDGDVLSKIEKFYQLRLAASFYPSTDPAIFKSGIGDYLNNPTNFIDLFKIDKSGPFIEIYEIIGKN